MNQDYYQYIHQIHQKQIEVDHLMAELSSRPLKNPTLRKRFLLTMSNALLGLGQRIRPAEFQVNVQVNSAYEGALEIEAEGC